LSTPDETNDNIVASWVPQTPLEPQRPFSYAYRLTASLDDAGLSPRGRVVNTFTAPPRALGSAEAASSGAGRFLVDFAHGDLAYYVADPSQVEAVATATNGEILRTSVAPNPNIDGLRAMFDVLVKPGETSDLRVFLRAGSQSLTETWTVPWTAPRAATAHDREERPRVQEAVSREAPDVRVSAFTPQTIRN